VSNVAADTLTPVTSCQLSEDVSRSSDCSRTPTSVVNALSVSYNTTDQQACQLAAGNFSNNH